MAIKIQPYTPEHEAAVHRFNHRLEEGSWEQRFPEAAIPKSLPAGVHPTLYNEMFVAVDGAGEVRGGYILKHQEFVVTGRVESIANYAFPLSEGVIDRRFGLVGVSMILDAQKRNPLLYGLGMGGVDHPSVRVMKGVGWSAEMVPFFFRVERPFAFLRNIAHLRRSMARRIALDALAYSGIGWLGLKFFNLLYRRSSHLPDYEVEIVSEFGDWADRVWARVDSSQGLMAVRDCATLAALYPPHDRYQIIKVSSGGEVIGWAVCINTKMNGSSYFGNMRVGTIVDGLAVPGKTLLVAAAADALLRQRRVHLMVSNQSHVEWRDALMGLGYRMGPSNFALTCSKSLIGKLGPLDQAIRHSLINRGDGDGPIHL